MSQHKIIYQANESQPLCHTSLFHNLKVIRHEKIISKAPLVIFDSNIQIDTIGTILELCKKYNKPGKSIIL